MIEETLLEAGDKMDKAVEVAKEDFASIRTGRATPGLYNKVMVEYYGTPTPLQQLASFAVPDARTILITPYDKTALRDIERALSDSEDRHTRMGWGSKCSQKRVCTMCTPWASDSVVPASDWAGLAMSSGEGRFFKAWRPVRVPPRAQCFLRSGAF